VFNRRKVKAGDRIEMMLDAENAEMKCYHNGKCVSVGILLLLIDSKLLLQTSIPYITVALRQKLSVELLTTSLKKVHWFVAPIPAANGNVIDFNFAPSLMLITVRRLRAF
jgi:hypothetical protein